MFSDHVRSPVLGEFCPRGGGKEGGIVTVSPLPLLTHQVGVQLYWSQVSFLACGKKFYLKYTTNKFNNTLVTKLL